MESVPRNAYWISRRSWHHLPSVSNFCSMHVSVWLHYLFGHAGAIPQLAESRSTIWTGMVLVLLTKPRLRKRAKRNSEEEIIHKRAGPQRPMCEEKFRMRFSASRVSKEYFSGPNSAHKRPSMFFGRREL